MVAQDGRHRGHHLGEPNHELDLAAAATYDVTFGPDALALRTIEQGGHEQCHAEPIGGTYVRCCCGCCVNRPRTHDDVPTGNVGRRLPRAIPRNLELDETVGCDWLLAVRRLEAS
jgi:hypothetical protein